MFYILAVIVKKAFLRQLQQHVATMMSVFLELMNVFSPPVAIRSAHTLVTVMKDLKNTQKLSVRISMNVKRMKIFVEKANVLIQLELMNAFAQMVTDLMI